MFGFRYHLATEFQTQKARAFYFDLNLISKKKKFFFQNLESHGRPTKLLKNRIQQVIRALVFVLHSSVSKESQINNLNFDGLCLPIVLREFIRILEELYDLIEGTNRREFLFLIFDFLPMLKQ